MHDHEKYICVESFKNLLYTTSVWVPKSETLTLDDRAAVCLYQIKSVTRTGKIIRSRPLGHTLVGWVRDKLTNQPYSKLRFPEKAERVLLKKIQAESETRFLYVLPVTDRNFLPIGGYIFKKIDSASPSAAYIGFISPQSFMALKGKGLLKNDEDKVQNFTADISVLTPQTTLPLADVYYMYPLHHVLENTNDEVSPAPDVFARFEKALRQSHLKTVPPHSFSLKQIERE